MIGCGAVNTASVTTKGTGNLTVATQSTGLLILNSQGGALALQSGGLTVASVSSVGITVGRNYQLYLDNATGGQCRITGDDAGSLYHQVNTTASSIYFSTLNAATVYGSFGVGGLTVGTDVVLKGGQYHLFNGYGIFGSTAVGAYNVIMGATVGRSGSTGTYNTLYGHGVAYGLTSGSYNTMLGNNLGYNMTSGVNNVLVGYQNGYNITTGYNNIVVGNGSGINMTTCEGNTIIGKDAGRSITTGRWNVAIGERALATVGSTGTGDYNIALGHYTFPQLTTGQYNTGLGAFAGTNVTTGTHNTYIGYDATASAGNVQYEIVIGVGLTGKGDYTTYIRTGDNNFWLSGYGSGTLTTSASGQVIRVSDKNLKNNIQYLSKDGSISRILSLKPCTYELKQDDIPHTYKGFIAQDVMEILPTAVDGKKHRFQFEKNKDGSPKQDEEGNIIYVKDGNGNPLPRYLGLNTTDILAEAVLAIQEQQTEIVDLKAQLALKASESVVVAQQTKIDSLEAQLQTLKATVDALVASK